MKQYNLGILGAGNIAKTMAETLHNVPRMNLYAVAARDKQRAESFMAENGGEVAYGSYEEMVRDEKVDLVYVATPHSLHYEHAKLCIESGKAVLCEKAFCGNAQQTEDLLRLAKEKNVFITEAIWPRYMPLAKKMRQLAYDGTIGEVQMVAADLGFPLTDKPRMAEPSLAGGALLDLGVYPITFASIVLGSDVQAVQSTGVLTEKGVDAQNVITLQYPGGKLAALFSTMTTATASEGVVYGSTGSIRADSVNNIARLEVLDTDGNLVESFTREEGLTGYEYEVEACIEALDNGWLECPDMPHAETLRVMQLMDDMRKGWGVQYPFD